ncbi:MAG: MerR family transcriptional regulator [Oscillospiraceae bacterium]|nr:MerR family transcriptional regulator [Oscillospiraceae bacterium]
MEKQRAIPEEYMTVGEIAKKMGVTVRTMHHYDKAGLLSPSSESESGYRLYSYKDMVKLNQILSMKYLGFSLDDIKNHLISLDTPDDVANALTEHAKAIRNKMKILKESLKAVETLKTEVVKMQSVDFKKYADIIACLQLKNENYWAIKYIDEDVIDRMSDNARHNKDETSTVMDSWGQLANEAEQLQREGVSPESKKGQIFANAVWNTIEKLTDGDADLISKFAESMDKLAESEEVTTNMDAETIEKARIAHNYMLTALEIYTNSEHDPTNTNH